jgi:stress responsive alpha/beta barrel protein
MTDPSTRVLHVVRWSLPRSDAWGSQTIDELAEAVRGLADIPGVESVQFGPRYATPWKGPDDAFDYAMAIVFASRDVIPAFIEHSAHYAAISLTQQIGATVQAFYADLIV